MSKVIFRDDGIIVIKDVRLSYEHVFQMWTKNAADPKERPRYSATFILPKDTHAAEIEAIKKHLIATQKEVFKQRLPDGALFMRDGDSTGKEEYAGAMIVVASQTDPKQRPVVVDRDGRTPIVEADDKVYSGCFVNGMIRPWTQNNQHGKRINANLYGVQFLRDGDRFSTSSRPPADEMFDDEGGDGDGFDD